MKIISYNVNGIRAAITKGFIDWLQAANPDVICLQEIKANENQIPTDDWNSLSPDLHQDLHQCWKFVKNLF